MGRRSRRISRFASIASTAVTTAVTTAAAASRAVATKSTAPGKRRPRIYVGTDSETVVTNKPKAVTRTLVNDAAIVVADNRTRCLAKDSVVSVAKAIVTATKRVAGRLVDKVERA